MKPILLFFLISVLFCGCNNQQRVSEVIETEKVPVKSILDEIDEPSQFFEVSENEPSTVKGRRGTIISINPLDLECEGGSISGKIKVELKELLNIEQLIKANAQTVSNGKLLISGGAYYINLSAGEQKLKLKQNKTLNVQFRKIAEEKMQLFYGERDSKGAMNWISANEQLEPSADIKTKPTKNASSNQIESMLDYVESAEAKSGNKSSGYHTGGIDIYKIVKLDKLGWINLDRFTEKDSMSKFVVLLGPADTFDVVRGFVVFKGINSLLTQDFYNGEQDTLTVPADFDAKLILLGARGKQVYSYYADLETLKGSVVVSNMEKGNKKFIEGLFGN